MSSAAAAAVASGECRNDFELEKMASADRHADGDWRQDLEGTHHSDTLGASAEPVLNHLCNGATAISHHKGWIRSPKASA